MYLVHHPGVQAPVLGEQLGFGGAARLHRPEVLKERLTTIRVIQAENEVAGLLDEAGDAANPFAPMPGLEPTDISVTVTGERVVIHGRERGPHQHERDLVLAQWAIGPYEGHVTLPEPVAGPLTNATYGNGVLVLAMPKVAPGQRGEAAEITLAAIEVTRGERVGHVSRTVRPTTTEEHLRHHRRRAIET